MAIAGLTSARDSARITFETLFDDVLAGTPAGVTQLFTDFGQVNSEKVNIGVFYGFPRPLVWDGDRVITDLVTKSQTYDLRTYQAAVKVHRRSIEKPGNTDIDQAFGSFFDVARIWMDDIILSALLANTLISYDGIELLSDSHPDAGSGGGDNLTTNAYSSGEMNTRIAAMRGRTDVDGRPLGIRPSHILAGPANEEAILAAVSADRAVFVDEDGNINTGGTPAAGGATTIPGLTGRPGRLTPVISEYVTGGQFVIMDVTKRGRPLIWRGDTSARQAIVDDPADGLVFTTDHYYYGTLLDGVPIGGAWQLIDGRIAA